MIKSVADKSRVNYMHQLDWEHLVVDNPAIYCPACGRWTQVMGHICVNDVLEEVDYADPNLSEDDMSDINYMVHTPRATLSIAQYWKRKVQRKRLPINYDYRGILSPPCITRGHQDFVITTTLMAAIAAMFVSELGIPVEEFRYGNDVTYVSDKLIINMETVHPRIIQKLKTVVTVCRNGIMPLTPYQRNFTSKDYRQIVGVMDEIKMEATDSAQISRWINDDSRFKEHQAKVGIADNDIVSPARSSAGARAASYFDFDPDNPRRSGKRKQSAISKQKTSSRSKLDMILTFVKTDWTYLESHPEDRLKICKNIKSDVDAVIHRTRPDISVDMDDDTFLFNAIEDSEEYMPNIILALILGRYFYGYKGKALANYTKSTVRRPKWTEVECNRELRRALELIARYTIQAKTPPNSIYNTNLSDPTKYHLLSHGITTINDFGKLTDAILESVQSKDDLFAIYRMAAYQGIRLPANLLPL